MIFVDNPVSVQGFAYTNIKGKMEYVNADTLYEHFELLDENNEDISRLYYEDIPKLILALQAAYDFKFKGEAQ